MVEFQPQKFEKTTDGKVNHWDTNWRTLKKTKSRLTIETAVQATHVLCHGGKKSKRKKEKRNRGSSMNRDETGKKNNNSGAFRMVQRGER